MFLCIYCWCQLAIQTTRNIHVLRSYPFTNHTTRLHIYNHIYLYICMVFESLHILFHQRKCLTYVLDCVAYIINPCFFFFLFPPYHRAYKVHLLSIITFDGSFYSTKYAFFLNKILNMLLNLLISVIFN